MSDFFDEALNDMKGSIVEDEGTIGAEEWDPKSEGQALRGIFTKAEAKATRYGPGFNCIIKDTDTGAFIKVWAKRSMLKSQLLDASPAAGSPIVFLYNGEKTAEGSGNTYHSYQVRAAKSDSELWKKYTAEASAAQRAFDERGAAPAAPVLDDGLDVPY